MDRGELKRKIPVQFNLNREIPVQFQKGVFVLIPEVTCTVVKQPGGKFGGRSERQFGLWVRTGPVL